MPYYNVTTTNLYEGFFFFGFSDLFMGCGLWCDFLHPNSLAHPTHPTSPIQWPLLKLNKDFGVNISSLGTTVLAFESHDES